ncbi:TonB-dependent receptor [Sphingomonas sp. S1-29]|uniref:TonB-dependent receptor n=1 Tax=Sphingomonas sp. S1-29 TaxID=2991074 RepID=UPI00223EDC41|nr:TonB-dependent receptor [Sphingomonas sp. S1-29]UZK68296.1 TonB-dependent receptor [Sphingomonas sp. S1-29]
MRYHLLIGAAVAALAIPGTAFAQSTASTEFDESSDIVVTGSSIDDSIGGVTIPNQPKAKVQLDAELIQRQRPGQSVNEIINLVPGVSNQSNDPYGSGGGNFRIRGFDSSRISQTLDGIPLNDSGNYALYTNQQQDPETLESVTVNLGATDVDSPTASAVGGTVNIRTRVPGDELGALFSGSYGSFDYNRVFGMLDTGDITGFGTKAFASASWTTYDNPFNNYGKIRKQQYNARIYQDIGSNGDFVSIAGQWNENRNNFFGSAPLRDEDSRAPGTGSGNRFPRNFDEATYKVDYPCNADVAQAGVVDVSTTCGTQFDRRFNPSNTGNIRGNSRFTLAEGLLLTIDPSYQYVKANGGGTILGREGFRTVNGTNLTGYIGNQYYFGRDLNGDGDALDTCSTVGAACASNNFQGVNLLSPSQTRTDRYIVIANLLYDINDNNRVRLAYTYDRAEHRQTGEVGFLQFEGTPFDVFPSNNPVLDGRGNIIQKRDRDSIALLNQVSGEYRGEFLDDNLVLNLGVRVPFFERDLTQNCFTTSAGGFVDCVPADSAVAYAAGNAGSRAPEQRTYKYDKVLPNVGFTYNFTPAASVFASYAKGISAPGTDVLYNAIFFAPGTEGAEPAPETSDSFDLGLRYTSRTINASISGFYIAFDNRIATAFDAEIGESVSRNIGSVKRYGVDGSIAYQPVPEFSAYVFGSYLKSEIRDDLLGGNCTAAQVLQGFSGCTTTGSQYFFPTGGKQESGISEYMVGARLQGSLGPIQAGVQYKYTGPRFINDVNLPLVTRSTTGATTELFGAKTDGYNIVDIDVRFSLADYGLEKTYFQLNVSNLFDQFFIGSVSGQTNDTSIPFVQIGVPRAISGSIVVGF